MDQPITDPSWVFAAVLAPFAAALLAPALVRIGGRIGPLLLALVPAGIFAAFALELPSIAGGSVLTPGIDWLPLFDTRFSFRVDGLSALFALLITGIGLFILVYAGGYMKGHPRLGVFEAELLAFMGSMLGLVLADDIITLFVFWEGTSITSFLLIGFDHTREKARRAAFQALVITGLGGLCLLAAMLLAAGVSGTHSLTGLIASGEALRHSPLYAPILILVLGAAFTKSAQMPFHVWLPNAMEAPTPVSAFLHSATMVKAGVYLLMRLYPVLGDTHLWTTILPFFGAVTLVGGAALALRQTDLKLTLAYTTVASLGLMVLLVGIGGEAALLGAAAYLLAHALFKGALFMVVGGMDHATGTRDGRRLSGLWRAMPITFVAALVAGLSMAGLPPLFGFVAKEALYDGLYGHGPAIAVAAAVLGNALMFAAAGLVALKPFLGVPRPTPKPPHESGFELWIGPLVLAIKGGSIALMLPVALHLVLEPMTSAIIGHDVAFDLHLLPDHVGPAVLLSAASVVLGIGLFLAADIVRDRLDALMARLGWGPDRGFDQMIAGLLRFASALTRTLQSGRLEAYMTATVLMIAAALLVPLFAVDGGASLPPPPDVSLHEAAIFLLATIGIVAVVAARSRLVAIVSLGVQGLAVAVLYMLHGAPDLAFTQFMVETLSVVILTLVMTRLRLEVHDPRPLAGKIGDGALALVAGFAFAAVLVRVTAIAFDDRLSAFYEANSRLLAHGRNIVNVIIVDFRGLDTLGEIAVVMITGLAILALVRIRGRRAIHEGDDHR